MAPGILLGRRLAVIAGGAALWVFAATAADAPKTARPAGAAPLDINAASAAQLQSLPYIGEAEARRIVAARPYLTKAELVTKDVLPAGVYQAIRHRIVALQPQKPPKPQKAAKKPPQQPDNPPSAPR
jgi:hypothetical protein